MRLIEEVRVDRSRCSRYAHTTLSLLQLVMMLAVAGKLALPNPLAINLLDEWSKPAVADIIVVASDEECVTPNFLVFQYQFNGMTMGCACEDHIIHSGYCLREEIEAGCTETTAVQPKRLTSYNSTNYFCAKTANMKSCDHCASGFCSTSDSDPCPVLDVQLGVFPPTADYAPVGHVDAIGRILFLSRNTTGRCPVVNITTVKGTEMCLNPDAENTQNFTSHIYSEITMLQAECKEGSDPRYTLLSRLPDYLMYTSNNLSLASEGNYFTTFLKSLPLVTSSSVDAALLIGQQGCRFPTVVMLLVVACSLVFIAQQLILHKFQLSKQIFSTRYSTALMLVTYLIYMTIASYSYSRLSDYLNLRSRITLSDGQSSSEMELLIHSVENCGKVLLALASISALAATSQLVMLILECKELCRKPILSEVSS